MRHVKGSSSRKEKTMLHGNICYTKKEERNIKYILMTQFFLII